MTRRGQIDAVRVAVLCVAISTELIAQSEDIAQTESDSLALTKTPR